MPSDLVPALLPLHERWFVDAHPGNDWGFFFSPLPLLLVAVAMLVTVGWRMVALQVRGPELAFLRPLAALTPWVPRLLGIHLGVSLLALAATGTFLSPAVEVDGAVGTVLLLLEAGVGIWLVTGYHLEVAAALVLAMGPALGVAAGWTALGECANLAAVAAFLVIVSPDADRYGATEPSRERQAVALLALRVGVGVALVVLAFSEKFTNPGMAVDTVQQYPALDVFAWVGIDLAPTTFITIAGAVELLFGLLVISGAFPQVAVLVAMVPFNATLLLFGQTELVGHLPVYGVFLALLVYGSDPATSGLVRWFPSRRAGATPLAEPAGRR